MAHEFLGVKLSTLKVIPHKGTHTFMLAWLIMFVLGGSIGFILASMIAAGRVAGLMRENRRLREELARQQYESRAFAELCQVSTPESSTTLGFPHPRLDTGADI